MSAASPALKRGSLKRFWRNIHLWLGIGLFILLVPIGLSGATLVYHDAIDEFLRTPKNAATPATPTDLALAVNNARKAAGNGFMPMSIGFPDSSRAPLTVSLRGPAQKGERPVRLVAYIDRSDAHVIEIVDRRNTFFGFMHVFHENLTIPFYYGRDIVGWGGVAMLILALTGLYLWWPRHHQWARAFAWRRSPATSSNLHYLAGFWVCFPLAFLSLTGIYLAWPQQGRAVLSSVVPMSEQRSGGPRGALMASPQRSAGEIFALAAARPNAQVDSISFPDPSGIWRVRLYEDGAAAPVMLTINDRSGEMSTLAPLSGDRTASWIRWLHEGSHAGNVWRLVVFVTGLMPALLGVTGILVWLRQRRQRVLIKKQSATLGATSRTPARDAAPAE